MIMKIVFLDIDGVLNHVSTKERFQFYNGIDEENLQDFAELMRLSSAEEETQIVLSSSWREDKGHDGEILDNGYQYICDRLASVGLLLFDITPILNHVSGYPHRGEEIAAWLSDHQNLGITGYVVLDDEHETEFKEYGLTKRFVKTSWESARGGFRKKHIKKAMEMLKLPYWEPRKEAKHKE